MKLEDIYYFAHAKDHHSSVFQLAARVMQNSSLDPHNEAEFQRRLLLLSQVSDPNGEQRRKAANFVCEMVSYDLLTKNGSRPLWVPETALPSPDLRYTDNEQPTLVEVKHLNAPRDEDEAISSGQMIGGSVDPNYEIYLHQKVEEMISSAKTKFYHFNQQINKSAEPHGELHLYYSQSIEAGLDGLVPWHRSMQEKVEAIANDYLPPEIEITVADINSFFK